MALSTKGFTAVMAQRREPPNALDYFPTPPWATRALFRHVLPALGVETSRQVWEPACGGGHMAEVIAEFTAIPVIATDVFDHGYGSAPVDFLDQLALPFAENVDWIITNPPFRPADQFALRALDLARVGVALLLRTQWLESEDRYRSIFRDRPPTLFAPFVERVPMLRGRWDPDASTATSYSWFVWLRGSSPRPIFWIPPGCRAALSRSDDRQRFAAPIQSDAPLFSPRPLTVDGDTTTGGDLDGIQSDSPR
jgi:predicted RNA methylase